MAGTRDKKQSKNAKTKSKNYLSESYNSRERNAQREMQRAKERAKSRERDRKNYSENKRAYYEEDMTYDEVKAKRQEERKRNRKKTNFFEKLVILMMIVAVGYLIVVTCKDTALNQTIEDFAGSGTLEQTITGKAKIIRDETVVYATRDGDVEYYYHEGDKIKNGSTLCKIYEKNSSKELQDEIDELDQAIVKAQNKNLSSALKEELQNVDDYIYGLIDEYLVYSNTDYQFDVYDLKSELESKFSIKRNLYLQNSNQSSSSYINERELLSETLDYNAAYLYAPKGGIISYCVDGYESNYTPENISELKGKYLQAGNIKLISGNKKNEVKSEDPVCKIVDNTAWYITATLSQEDTKNWTINDVKTLRVKNVSEGTIVGTIVNVLEYNNSNIITFKITEQMSKYMSFRDIEIEVIENEVSGIKIRNTSLEKKECIKLPAGCVVNKNNNYYVIKSEGGMKKQQQINIAYIDNSNYYVLAEDGTIKKGEYVIVTDKATALDGTETTTERTLMVGENVTVSGVYKVAGSIYKYVVVNVLASNDTYSIVEDSESSELILFDKVVVDYQTIKNKEKN
ncbi:MAG: hypothetical protein MJ245_01825 [Clostridia bacterium]|nr:hypothetical protein [Clostridia bacterium]